MDGPRRRLVASLITGGILCWLAAINLLYYWRMIEKFGPKMLALWTP